MMRLRPNRALPAILLASATLTCLSGCLPKRIAIDLDPREPRLYEQTLERDLGTDRASAKIALIRVEGLIADAPLPTAFGAGPNPVDEVVRRLDRAADDPIVRAVILRVNSPGGTVTGSDIMYQEIMRFRERTGKPVIACIGEIGASGGYFVSLAADEIVAMPSSTTASIGVILQLMNFSDGLSRIGITAHSVTSGPNKSMASPFEPEKPEHLAILQGIIDEHYAGFYNKVRTRRPALSDENAVWVTDGRVVTGQQAYEVGLIDQLGGIREAFDTAKALAGVDRATLVGFESYQIGTDASPYWSRAEQPGGATTARAEINVLGLGLNALERMDPGFYYLWAPALPN